MKWTEKVRAGEQLGIDPPGITVAPQSIPLHKPVAPIPSRRAIRLFGKRLPGAMLLASAALAAVVVLVVVVIVQVLA